MSCTQSGYKKPTLFPQNVALLAMPRLTQESRDQAIGMLRAGIRQNDVAHLFGVSPSTVSRLLRRYQDTGATRDRPRPGQRRVTTRAQDRYIRTSHLRDRLRTAVQTAAETPGRARPRISARTVQRRLREEGIRPYRAHVGLDLTAHRRNTRLLWSRQHSNRNRNWQNARWRDVVFSDESRFLLYRHDGRRRVYRRRGERFADPCVVQQDRFGGGGVMVWGAIRSGWRSPLVIFNRTLNAQRYLDLVLRPHVVPYVTGNQGVIFMHDNARPHVAHVCMDFLHNQGVEVLEWPPYSPDINPIEHVWDIMDRQVRQRYPPPQNVAQLRQALMEEWDNVPQRQINTLLNSMPRRINAVMAANGGHTRY